MTLAAPRSSSSESSGAAHGGRGQVEPARVAQRRLHLVVPPGPARARDVGGRRVGQHHLGRGDHRVGRGVAGHGDPVLDLGAHDAARGHAPSLTGAGMMAACVGLETSRWPSTTPRGGVTGARAARRGLPPGPVARRHRRAGAQRRRRARGTAPALARQARLRRHLGLLGGRGDRARRGPGRRRGARAGRGARHHRRAADPAPPRALRRRRGCAATCSPSRRAGTARCARARGDRLGGLGDRSPSCVARLADPSAGRSRPTDAPGSNAGSPRGPTPNVTRHTGTSHRGTA